MSLARHLNIAAFRPIYSCNFRLFSIISNSCHEYHGLSWHFTRQVFVGEKEDAFVQHKLVHELEYCLCFCCKSIQCLFLRDQNKAQTKRKLSLVMLVPLGHITWWQFLFRSSRSSLVVERNNRSRSLLLFLTSYRGLSTRGVLLTRRLVSRSPLSLVEQHVNL